MGNNNNSNDEEILDKIVLEVSATKLDKDRIFYIGPLNRSVGFKFQQYRALRLVAALRHKYPHENNPSIAIVGAGLAGLTAYHAFYRLGYADVILYEQHSDYMPVQRAAHHRLIHPNYNDWPLVDKFGSTTNFPFLNWYINPAENVIEQIREFCKHTEPGIDPIPSPDFNHKILDIEKDETKGSKPVKLTLKESDKKDCEAFFRNYDLVLFAGGFGSEEDLDLSSTSRYWTEDTIFSNATAEDGEQEFIVSGIGDGGLIDCIRCAFDERKVPDICNSNKPGPGSLQMSIITELRSSQYREPAESDEDYALSTIEKNIRDAEADAQSLLEELKKNKEKASPNETETDNKTSFGTPEENKVAEYLCEKYKSIVRRLVRTPKVNDLFENARLQKNKVLLVGPLSRPFKLNTAPINKLIIAYLMNETNDSFYIQGRVVRDKEDGTVRLIKADEYKTDETSRGEIIDGKKYRVIRHGTKSLFKDLLPEKNSEFYSNIKSLVENFKHDDMNAYNSLFRRPSGIIKDKDGKPDAKRIVDIMHFKQASQFMSEYYRLRGEEYKEALTFGYKHSSKYVFISLNQDIVNETEFQHSRYRTGGVDREIFGIPVRRENNAYHSTTVDIVEEPNAPVTR